MTGRVAVVGGGVAGLATAYRLLAAGADPIVGPGTRGRRVARLDRRRRPRARARARLAGRAQAVGGSFCRTSDCGWPRRASGAMLWTDAGLVSYLSGTAFGIPGDVGDVLRWPGPPRRTVPGARGPLKRKRRDGVEETLGGSSGAGSATRRPTSRSRRSWPASTPATSTACRPRRRSPSWSRGRRRRAAWCAARRPRSGPRRADPGPMFLRPRRGMRELVDALVARSATASGRRAVVGVDEEEIGSPTASSVWTRSSSRAGRPPPRRSGAASRRRGERATTELAAIELASTAVVFLVYPSGTADALPDASGFVVPGGARR